ncbi:hypothetical protein MUK70_29155 [Dyadobacter chenwenxiniae]|uniref:Uncharacterized protein n=1 Tax=Dyadobacter chenwenxiniae TaxID=2906456 RepID=A0A9X1PP92_9BACT|nr:hypothetical protein [Dyadobacter chenwenxiniae]MCF0064952.1 hypothetical protein [Dyadobacter chenwenxiniae]UON83073.1 hypothetical protein MUK70_29155 [Dyadobacter chenwenxiniae]
MSKSTFFWITALLVFLTGSGLWLWNRFGPTTGRSYPPKLEAYPVARTIDSSSSACDLVVRRYKQIGEEMQFELAANASGLSPYNVEIAQKGKIIQFKEVPHRFGIWLSTMPLALETGPATIKIISLGQPGCETSAAFEFDKNKKVEILDPQSWIRQGSKDNWLDVRPIMANGKLHLKDFGNYDDGRTKVVMIDGIEVKGLENGIEAKPGYLYSITARWIDAPYNDWWNKMRNRSIRQQNIWISGNPGAKEDTKLTRIEIPKWFSPSRTINVDFDTKFPEFEPIKGKLVMQYQLNDYVPTENYYKRGINYLYNGKDTPAPRMHYTATPNYFGDKDEKWFSSLSQSDVESRAIVPNFGVYALDFEFWNQHYIPEVKQRLIWFARTIRKNHPEMYLMDYWGGGAYTNPHINTMGGKNPKELMDDYNNPKPNNSNFEALPNGDSFHDLFNATPIDVYPKPMFVKDEKGNTPNNFVLLSAIHSLRINKLIPYQKDNKLIFFGWNRYMPLYSDPIVPWNYQLTDPKGELVMNQLETMPASQALSMSLFSLIMFDGYYLWHDSGPSGKDPNAYKVGSDASSWGHEWYPADGKTPESEIGKKSTGRDAAYYWDYPTQYYSLGNWMAKQVEDVIVGGTNKDLAFELNGNWIQPKKEQALLAIDKKEPFVTSIVKGNQIVVLGVDSFQSPTANRVLKVKLPDGSETSIELYGNWPSLYRGTLK